MASDERRRGGTEKQILSDRVGSFQTGPEPLFGQCVRDDTREEERRADLKVHTYRCGWESGAEGVDAGETLWGFLRGSG